ncbi:MAG TPA: DHA2 family efflux MFS transporter permease subunit, partial [Caulobacteraceae bacterium]|nr:DHA2 family efflux MFS transporter permease subunit [Caulobacteraceae bacterium]
TEPSVMPTEPHWVPVPNKGLITLSVMLATIMQALDTTIANVALPRVQGTLSATQDEMGWVLTSYIVAAAITIPLTGWLASEFGRRKIFLLSIVLFTIASVLCGLATSLPQIVFFRFLQGVGGAALVPLSQAVLFDINPPKEFGRAMSIWGVGVTLGPILGPALGGWLTENYSWRWVFFINLPVGVLAFSAVSVFMTHDRSGKARPFDFLGFGALVVAIGGMQLVLDRGPTQDWFSSPEIWTEALLGAGGLYVFVVQTLTSRHPFFDRALALDRNFLTCNVFGFFIGLILFSTMALLPPVMQGPMGYSVFGAGLVMMPRGLGSFAAMFVVGRLVGRVDTRLILLAGLGLCAMAMLGMSHFDLSMDAMPFVTTGIVQGLGIGLLFVPLSVTAFATLDPGLRAEGTAMYTLVRNIGSSVGISLMEAFNTRQAAVAHADMAAHVQPSNPVFAAGIPSALNPATNGGLEALNGEITRQASMVGLIDVFHLMLLLIFALIPLLLLMRSAKSAPSTEVVVE